MPAVHAPAPAAHDHPPTDPAGTCRNWKLSGGGPQAIDAEPAAVLDGLLGDPSRADRVRESLRRFPAVGTAFAGFQLVALLGKGAFGRVYLARQDELAERYVALKVSADLTGECRTLAQLQHTNIVPVYSAHRADGFEAVCMPYLGPITLAGLLHRCRQKNALPTTGRELVHTLNGLSDDTAVATGLPSHRPSSVPAAGEPEPASGRLPDRAPVILQVLDGLSYLDAVCWLGGRLADALTHAHDRGIVHNDLKPANVLLADDGQPMLLDFGVSDDLKLRAEAPDAPVGGTLPYMSPEQLAAVRGRDWTPDPRSDVYALGVILFELLTAAHPFRTPAGSMSREVDRMIAERQAGAPRLRPRNPAVSPGLEAIVRKALAPDAAARYQSAAQLRDDLDCHRTNQPLLHCRVPSARERLRKWSRRHPRLTSNAALAGMAATVLLGLGVGLQRRSARIERFEAEADLRAVAVDVQAARYQLVSRAPTSEMVTAGLVRSRAALDRYGVLAEGDWQRHPRYESLTPAERDRLRTDLVEACLLLARGGLTLGGADQAGRLAEAMRLNERAERLAGGDVPRVLWTQRAELLKRQGDAGAADAAAQKADGVPVVTARDHYLAGREAHAAGRPREALALLETAANLDPSLFWAHMTQGRCWEDLGHYAQARGCYTTAIALWPDFPWGHFNRGLTSLRLSDFARAKDDLDRAAALEPTFADIYLNRAMANQGLRRFAEGIADLDRAGELGTSPVRVCFMKARLRELAGDPAGAKQDVEAGLKLEPTDEHGWTARGVARSRTDPAGAADDFAAALAVNPRSLVALQNQAHVLGKLGRNAEAVQALDRAVELFPEYAPSRAGRGVIHARLGHWEAAEADAREAVHKDASAANVYQVAGIFALLTGHDPKHKPEALQLLTTALRAGFGFEHVETDPELAPLRGDAEFDRVVVGVRSLRPSTPR